MENVANKTITRWPAGFHTILSSPELFAYKSYMQEVRKAEGEPGYLICQEGK